MNITKAILQSLVNKTIAGVKINEDNIVLEFKSGEKVTLYVNLNKGVSYDSHKEKTNTKIDRVAKQGEKALATVSDKDPVPKRKHKKKENT